MVEGPFRQHRAVAAKLLSRPPSGHRRSGTRSAPSTMARWAGPMTPSGTRRWKGRRLRRCWMGYKLFIGYMRQLRRDLPLRVPLAPRGRSSNLHLGAGYGRSRAPGGCCSRRTSHTAWPVPNPTGDAGTPGSPSTPGPLRTFPSSGLELRLCG